MTIRVVLHFVLIEFACFEVHVEHFGWIRHQPGLKVIKKFEDLMRREDPFDLNDELRQFFSELGPLLAHPHEPE
jgi:hypothetical protein